MKFLDYKKLAGLQKMAKREYCKIFFLQIYSSRVCKKWQKREYCNMIPLADIQLMRVQNMVKTPWLKSVKKWQKGTSNMKVLADIQLRVCKQWQKGTSNMKVLADMQLRVCNKWQKGTSNMKVLADMQLRVCKNCREY